MIRVDEIIVDAHDSSKGAQALQHAIQTVESQGRSVISVIPLDFTGNTRRANHNSLHSVYILSRPTVDAIKLKYFDHARQFKLSSTIKVVHASTCYEDECDAWHLLSQNQIYYNFKKKKWQAFNIGPDADHERPLLEVFEVVENQRLLER